MATKNTLKNGKKAETQEKSTTLRQLPIPNDTYGEMETLQLDIKKETGKKPPSETLLVELIADGLKYRKKMNSSSGISNQATEFNKWDTLTRDDISRIKEQVMQGISTGSLNAKELMVSISSFERVFIGEKDNPGIKTLIGPYVAKEIKQNHTDKEKSPPTEQVGNFQIIIDEIVVYDYSNDPAWQMMRTEEQVAAEKRKGREEFLKAIAKADKANSSPESIEGVTYSIKPPKEKIVPRVICKLTK